MNTITQRIACKALIIHDEKILIIREAATNPDGTQTGKWGLPGGRVEPGECWQDGLTREINEETGLTCTIGSPLYVGEWSPVIHDMPHHIICIFFVCRATTSKVTLSEEHDAHQWISPEDYPQFALVKPEDDVLATYLRAAK